MINSGSIGDNLCVTRITINGGLRANVTLIPDNELIHLSRSPLEESWKKLVIA